MNALKEILRKVGAVADYSGIEVTDPNTRGLFGTFPLHVAATWGDCEAITILVASGARINQKGEHGFSPLMEAVAQGHADAAKLLISLGAEAIPNDDGNSPSQYAAIGGYNELAQYLSQQGF